MGVEDVFKAWDVWLAAGLATLLTLVQHHLGDGAERDRAQLIGTTTQVIGSLLGFGIAAFAIVFASLAESMRERFSKQYPDERERREHVEGVFGAFLVDALILATALTVAVCYLLVGDALAEAGRFWEVLAFGVALALSLLSVFTTLQLLKMVVTIAITAVLLPPPSDSATSAPVNPAPVAPSSGTASPTRKASAGTPERSGLSDDSEQDAALGGSAGSDSP